MKLLTSYLPTSLRYPLIILLFFCSSFALAQSKPTKMKILVHITCGPADPTRAALGFLVAKTALDEGHSVTLFLAGEAVLLLRDDNLNSVTGIGTGKLRDHYDAIVKAGSKF